jgi:helicase
MKHLEGIIEKMLHLLEDWDFVHSSEKSGDFESALDLKDKKYRATALGLRVAELYLDPLTANYICNCLRRAENRKLTAFSFMQMVCHSLEMRPLLKAKMKEYDKMQETLAEHDSELLEDEPSMFEYHYEEFLNSIKTALFMNDWIEEKDEEYLLETYDIRPGEIRVKLDIADWLLYASYEITRILELQPLLKEITRVRIRLKYGVKEELLPLIKLKNVGRIRARMLFRNNIRDIGDIKKTDLTTLGQILGKQIAMDIKKQVETGIEPTKPGKRKGQIALDDYE